MCKKIKIQAYDLKSETISGLKDPLKLHIPKSFGCKIQGDYNAQDYYIIPCIQELEKGIYEFNIEEQIPLYSQVFVQLIGHTTYCKDPYFLHSTCTQINLLECMIECNKPIPFVFASSPKGINIGILKAYKVNSLNHQREFYFKNTNTNTNLNSNTGIDKNTNTDLNTNLNLDSSLKRNTSTNQSTDANTNTNLDSNTNPSLNENTNTFLKDSTNLNHSHNEIYTLDTEQTIQLRAFIYEEQRTYVERVTNQNTETKRNHSLQQGNITKNIKELLQEESCSIRWAFKIVSASYHGKEATTGRLKKGQNKGGEPFPPLKSQFMTSNDSKKDYVYQKEDITDINQILENESYVVMNQTGDCITLSLKDLFTDKVLDSLINKNIIFFAYVKNPDYCIYNKNSKKQVLQDRVTSIELKILQTRFSLEFNGETLTLLENQRTIGEWNARSGIPIENLQEDSNENKQRQRFCIPYKNNQSFYYDLSLHKDNTTKPLSEGEYFIQTTYNPTTLDLKGIHLLGEQQQNLKEDICKTFQTYKIQENLFIPLKVQYQKRILIVIERFKQTTESTMGRIYMGVDGKRAEIKIKYEKIKTKDSKGVSKEERDKEIYEAVEIQRTDIPINLKSLPNDKAFGVILDRPGPDSIGGELNLRIPSGRYEPNWRNGSFGDTLNFHNNFVHKNRFVLVHSGNSPKDSAGCMLLSHSFVKKGKQELELLQAKSKDVVKAFAVLLERKIPEYLGVKARGKSFIDTFVEIYIVNSFKE